MQDIIENSLQTEQVDSPKEIMVKIENVSKQYKLGMIGGTTLKDEIKRFWAKVRKKEDPTKKIGAKDYNKGEKFMALENVSFEVEKGDAIGLIGHNGAGKSTLLKLITRVTAPTQGKIYLNGRVASMLEVGTGFHGELTGRENIYMNGAILGMTKKEIDAKIEDIIDFSEVRQFIDTPVKRYSSGMFVKLAFSVAAHLDAEILLMDEVLAVGDMAFQAKCINKMREVANSGRTILYVSHNMNTIRQLCNKCVVLKQGQVEFVGGVEEGINMYLQKHSDGVEVDIDLAKVKHVPAPYASLELFVKRLEFVNKVIPVFDDTEKMRLHITCDVKEDLHDIKFLLMIKTTEDTRIGSTYSDNFSITKGNNKELDLILDLNDYGTGKYCVNLTCIQMHTGGANSVIDFITDAFNFEVVQAPNSKKIIWYSPAWGRVKYADCKVELK